MSFKVEGQSNDEQFERDLSTAVENDLAGDHHNPQSRRALVAARDFVKGAVLNLPAKSQIAYEITGHIESVTGYGQIEVKVELGAQLAP